MAHIPGMYSLLRQTHPATAIEHSIYCHFFNSNEKNLVSAGANILRIFRLLPDFDSSRAADKQVNLERRKLECIQSYQLFGNVMSLQAVQLSGSNKDALLLSFRDAKLSVVEYDPATHDLKTLSLHYFEEDDMKDGRTQIHEIPTIRVDPEGRCAAMLVYGNRIVILPFRKDSPADDTDLTPGPAGSSYRAPVMASYTIHIRQLDERMDNIIDMQFLHGYYEPTLLFLFEPIKTWAGRIAVRQDTVCMAAVSLNVQQKVHPVIWSINSLPFDCMRAFAVPKPIGGALIFAVNSLLYLNQSVPPYGVALNGFTDDSTSFPLKLQEGVKIALDCSQAEFISYDRLVISLKGGELYVLTLLVDGMRSVRGFNFDKAASSVLTTCMCICEDGFLFLGSRLGNSLLLKYIEKNPELDLRRTGEVGPDGKLLEEPPTKKKRLDTLGDWMAGDVALIEDPEELEVYGISDTSTTSTHISSYIFEVCDSLLNVAPCGNVCMGEPAFLSEEFANDNEPDIELVTTSGYGKNGALSVLQRSVRPQVVTTFELPGCTDMWTVIGPHVEPVTDGEDKQEEEPVQPVVIKQEKFGPGDQRDTEVDPRTNQPPTPSTPGNSHAFLILSRPDSTMILQTGAEINEVDHSGFSTQASTVFAGNIGDNKFIVQVSPMGVRLLEGVNQIQHIPLDVGSRIVHASIADPFLVIMSDEGQLILLTFRPESFESSARLAISKPYIPQKYKILTVCVYKDTSGLFTTSPREEVIVKETEKPTVTTDTTDPFLLSNKDDGFDEELLLYGNSEPAIIDVTPKDLQARNQGRLLEQHKEHKPTYWIIMTRENGVLEIYSLPELKLVYLVKNFSVGLKVLVDSIQMTASGVDKSDKQFDNLPAVKEVMIAGLGYKGTRPHLLARVEDDLFIYEAFQFYDTQTEHHLKLRFRKIAHNLMVKERKHKSRRKQEQADAKRNVYFRYYEDIAGYSGVFICGAYPYWLLMTYRGELRTHPMGIDGWVTSFAAFNNVNCPKGFLYFNKQGELRICVLPTHMSYDSSWPVRKVPLRCTPHFVTYHMESKTYCVVTSVSEPCTRLCRAAGDEKEYEDIERPERFIPPPMDKFFIQLFSPVNWEAIPNTKFELEEWELCTCLKNVSLFYEGSRTGLKGYLAFGTNYTYGEDVTSRGRIFILDIIEVVPEPGQPLTKNRIKIIYDKEQKGPVTSLCHVNGYLLSCIGQKIYIWQLKDNDLSGIAFIDTQIYIHTAVCIKNLILVADIYKSVSVLRFQDEARTLSLVSRDVKPLEVYGIEFVVDNNQLGFLVSDVDKNLLMFMYQPELRESYGGQRLLRRADIHVGQHINSFFRIRCRLTDPAYERKVDPTLQHKHVTMFATLDGGLGYLLPVPEKTYRRLFMLQNVLITGIPHTAGLNPKAFRMYRSSRRLLVNPHKNILDGDLLYKFLSLSLNEKAEMAKRIGASSEQVLEDLVEIERVTGYF